MGNEAFAEILKCKWYFLAAHMQNIVHEIVFVSVLCSAKKSAAPGLVNT